jgi:NAD(P)-dependent dehydrogenase (short-subunit alcohol dehydrogenase family)
MPVAIVTGSGGLIGSESVRHFVEAGYTVIGLENDMRATFFGPDASTARTTDVLVRRYADAFRSLEIDIRDSAGVSRVFAQSTRPRTRSLGSQRRQLTSSFRSTGATSTSPPSASAAAA